MTAIEDYNVFAGEMEHPRDRQDNLREFHDSYMIDLQPHKDAVHEARIVIIVPHTRQTASVHGLGMPYTRGIEQC